MKTIVKNIKELVNVDYKDRTWSSGKDMSKINTIEDAFIEINNGIPTNLNGRNENSNAIFYRGHSRSPEYKP